MFSDCIVLPGSKETELGGCDQEACPSVGENTGCHNGHGSVSLQLFLVVWIFPRSLGFICYNK